MASPSSASPPPRELLGAALAGDDQAFRRLVEPHRAELHAHAYRMLGSLHDADDALQETLLRAWRGLSRFQEGRPLRPWLFKITTNVCLDLIARRPRRLLPTDHGPPTDPGSDDGRRLAPRSWVEPYPDAVVGLPDRQATPEVRYEQREAIELAFVAALQHLPGRQRAVLILRDVVGLTAREVAEGLDTTVASVNSALQRARATIDRRRPGPSQQTTLRSLGDRQVRDLVGRFVAAFESGDIPAILALLAADAIFSMPPYAAWCRGREAIGDSWLMPGGRPPRLRYVPTRANGQIALGTYLLDPERRRYLPLALDVVTMRGAEIVDVTAYRTPDLFPPFDLPPELVP